MGRLAQPGHLAISDFAAVSHDEGEVSVFDSARVEIGDIDVVDASRPWVDEIIAWADAYRAATGEKLAFMQSWRGRHDSIPPECN